MLTCSSFAAKPANRGSLFLDEQFSGQEWLPIDNRPLQVFLAAAPRTETSRVLQPESLLGRLI